MQSTNSNVSQVTECLVPNCCMQTVKNIFGVLQILPGKMSLFSAILKSRKPQNWCITSFLYFMCPKNVICCENSMFCGFYHKKIFKNTLSDQAKLCTLCNTPKIIFHMCKSLVKIFTQSSHWLIELHVGEWQSSLLLLQFFSPGILHSANVNFFGNFHIFSAKQACW